MITGFWERSGKITSGRNEYPGVDIAVRATKNPFAAW
jgi:hypothetical protein